MKRVQLDLFGGAVDHDEHVAPAPRERVVADPVVVAAAPVGDLFADAGVGAPRTDPNHCPGCGRVYGACDRRADHFNHATGYNCEGCGKHAICCQWCMVVTLPECSPAVHQHVVDRQEARAAGELRERREDGSWRSVPR